ncbi:DeoR family transcriptional regulator [Hydrogenispora ethanolica]|uniref:DeoR family transcriptional regulator n=1 Tax=Hydrogenispora ethanolica TaxID=1082276 RepID=A0A4R1R7F3_HYDET|nr:DeoR/GlpR family DNA-binding transcription regulator [Hydrogenispora ethanolica]TCL61450.1 DeoR family transcriptional regulator [Hydrogenispora ethanolica]
MFPEERQSKILDILSKQGRCLVGALAQELGVSMVTVRQDLDLLERRGLLRRTHGGAILNAKTGFERPFQIEETSFKTEKERIAAAAVKEVSSGDTVILDVGTTTTEVARLLKKHRDLTVVTNAVNIALILEDNPDITTVVTGGTLRAKQHSLVNPYAELILEKINADLAFIGVSGVAADYGYTNVNLAEAELKSLFFRKARRRIVLADSSKIGNVARAKVADLLEADRLITDRSANAEEVARLRERGLEVQLV